MAIADVYVPTLNDQLAQAAEQLHGAAASIGDSKARYKATGDRRFVDAVNNVIPIYNYWLGKYKDIAHKLGREEQPTQFLVTLSETSDWLKAQGVKVAEAAVDTVAAAPKLANALPTLLTLAFVAAGLGAVAYISGNAGSIIRAVKKAA